METKSRHGKSLLWQYLPTLNLDQEGKWSSSFKIWTSELFFFDLNPGSITSWNQDRWEKYQQPQICRWHYPYGRKRGGTKEPSWWKWKRRVEKVGLKLSIQKIKIMASGPITSWQMGKQWKLWQILFWGAPKSLQMVTAAMKLKDACSLEEKLWPT